MARVWKPLEILENSFRLHATNGVRANLVPTPSTTSTAYSSSDLLKCGRCVLNCKHSIYLTQSRHLESSRIDTSTALAPAFWSSYRLRLSTFLAIYIAKHANAPRKPTCTIWRQSGPNSTALSPAAASCFTRLQLYTLYYRHQKHHNSIDITGVHAPTTETATATIAVLRSSTPQPNGDEIFLSLSSKCGRIPSSATSPHDNLRTNSGETMRVAKPTTSSRN